jgi:hypothetical protein
MTNDALLQLIERAAIEGWTTVSLSSLDLSSLPPESGKLTPESNLIVLTGIFEQLR